MGRHHKHHHHRHHEKREERHATACECAPEFEQCGRREGYFNPMHIEYGHYRGNSLRHAKHSMRPTYNVIPYARSLRLCR